MKLLRQLWLLVGGLVAAFAVSWLVFQPDAQERGVWRAKTGGQIITLSRWRASLFTETATSCTLQLSFPAHLKLVEWAEGVTVDVSDDTLRLTTDGTLDPILFDRTTDLPDTCGPADPNASARQVFDVFWDAMSTHYAFFDLHGVNWQDRRSLRPAENAQLSDADLFSLLSDALAGLDDGHVQLATAPPTPAQYFSPAQRPDWLAPDMTRASLWQAARSTFRTPLTPVDLTAIEYALLSDGTGYVMIRHMGLNTPFGAKEDEAMARAFAQVASALAAARRIVVDVRYNPGGSDTVAFAIASYFIDQPVDVLTKTSRTPTGQTAPFTATLAPAGDTPLRQPVVVLTSRLTGSAAEIFALALRTQTNVTLVGEATSGGLSDILEVTLPNGWSLGLSHQTYKTMDGTLYEAIGIPPDTPIAMDADALSAGQDPILRAVLDGSIGQ